jgi:hypothetical protein
MVSTEVSLKVMEALKRCAAKNGISKNKLTSNIVNLWDGDIDIIKEAHRHKLGVFIPEYEDARHIGIQLNVNISEKINKVLIDILNREDNVYTKPGLVRDIIFGFLFFGNKKLVKKLKNINIICDDYSEFLKEINSSRSKSKQDNNNNNNNNNKNKNNKKYEDYDDLEDIDGEKPWEREWRERVKNKFVRSFMSEVEDLETEYSRTVDEHLFDLI